MHRAIALPLSLLLVVAAAAGARADDASEFPVKVHEKVLPNGFQILVIPREGVPNASCALTYDVGSVNERVGQTGMAHYLEHMMFKGTEKMGVKDLALDAKYRVALDAALEETVRLEDGPSTPEVVARLEALKAERAHLIEEQKQNLEINHLFTIYGEGGSTFTNAMTGHDGTTYIAALPPEHIELFFWVEADRLQHCVFRQFHAEKDVVREERRMYENRPGALFDEAVQRAIFGSHPYAHPILGYHQDLRAMTREELRAFFSTYYAVDNAVLMVAGDVDPERVFALAERYFGSIPPSSGHRPRVPILAVPRSGEIRMQGRGAGQTAVDLYYRVPAAGTEEALALELLAMHLGDEEGPLFQDLVEKQKIAVSLAADYDARKYGGVIHVNATLAPNARHADAEARITRAIEALQSTPLSEEAMASLRRRFRADTLGAVRSDMRLGFLILRREMTGSWRDIERDLQRVKTLPAAAIQEAAATYLVPANAVITHYTRDESAPELAEAPAPLPAHLGEPRAAGAAVAEAARPSLPASWKDLTYEKRTFELPSGRAARKMLSNGMRAFLVPNVGDPSVRVSARILGGSAGDPAGKEGLSAIAARLLAEAGIPGMPREALKEHLETLVASVSASSDVDDHRLTISVFPADLDEGLRILGLLLRSPDLDATAFARIQGEELSRIDAQDTRMRGVTSRLYRELLWGDVPETRRPTRESIEAITLEDVRARLESVTGPERTILAVSGDFDVDAMAAKLDGTLGAWKAEGVAAYEAPNARAVAASAETGLHVRPMTASQGSVRIGQPTVPATHEDAPALRVLAAILARRTFNTIRSVHGLAYQASTQFAPSWRHDSPFTVLFQTKNESVPFAIGLAVEELKTIREEGPTAEEVAEAKQGLESAFRRTFGRGFDAAETFAELEANGIPLEHYHALREAYASVDAAAVQAAAKRHIDPNRLLILCVGDLEAMKGGDGQHPPTLADFGEVTVHAAPAARDEGTPEAVIRQILTAFGGGDMEGVKAHATEAMRKRLEETPGMADRLGMFQRMLGTATVSDPLVALDGATAQGRVTIEATLGEQSMVLEMRMDLVKEGDAWKCDTFSVGPRDS